LPRQIPGSGIRPPLASGDNRRAGAGHPHIDALSWGGRAEGGLLVGIRRNCVWLLAFAALVLAFSGSAFAAKGGTGGKPSRGTAGGGSISLVVENSADGLPHWGGQVTFTISTTATTQPWVELKCSQNGTVVAQGFDGFFAGSLTTENFGLYSPQWTSGAADCTAVLETPQWAVLASTSFHVYA
jgi:hypothetical protein